MSWFSRGKKDKIPSKVNRKGGRKGCLCEDGKYRKECCDGSLWAQGIGQTEANSE